MEWKQTGCWRGRNESVKSRTRHQCQFHERAKSVGGDGRKNAQRGVSEAQTDGAAEQSKQDAFEQRSASDASAASAQRCAHGELLTAAFDADEEQVGDISAWIKRPCRSSP